MSGSRGRPSSRASPKELENGLDGVVPLLRRQELATADVESRVVDPLCHGEAVLKVVAEESAIDRLIDQRKHVARLNEPFLEVIHERTFVALAEHDGKQHEGVFPVGWGGRELKHIGE